MDSSFLRLNQLFQQNPHAGQAGSEPHGSAAAAATAGVVEGDGAGFFWGGEGFPYEGMPFKETGAGGGTENGAKHEGQPQRFMPTRADSATSPRTASFLAGLTNDFGLLAGTEVDPLVVPYTPQDLARQMGAFSEPAQLPDFQVGCSGNALGFIPFARDNFNGLQTPWTHETATLHDFGATPATDNGLNDFGNGYTPCGSTPAQSFYSTPAISNYGDFDQPVIPAEPNWYYGGQVLGNTSAAPYAANGYQQADAGFPYAAHNGNGDLFTHQVQAAALPPAGYGDWQQDMGNCVQQQASTSYSVVRAPTPLHLEGFPYYTAPNAIASGSWAPAEAQLRTQVSSAHRQTQDFPTPSGSRTRTHAAAESPQKDTVEPRKTSKKAAGKVKSSLSKVVTSTRTPPRPHAILKVGCRSTLRAPVTVVPFAERNTTTAPNAVVSYYDACKAQYTVTKDSTLPRIKCPVENCNERFTCLSSCRRHVKNFADLYVQKQLDDPAHLDVLGGCKLRNPGNTAVACGYPGCVNIYSRSDAATRHRKVCEFKLEGV